MFTPAKAQLAPLMLLKPDSVLGCIFSILGPSQSPRVGPGAWSLLCP